MSRVSVESSNIESVGHDETTDTLEVEFKSGAVYVYDNVPRAVFDGLISASSVGRYFNSYVRDVYTFVQV